MNGHVLALHALPRAGKDTLARLLAQHHGYQHLAFADKLYAEVCQAYGVEKDLMQSTDWKTRPQSSLALWNCGNEAFRSLMIDQGFKVSEPLTARQVLQHWGTSYRRASNPRYWVDALLAEMTKLLAHGHTRFVISDSRPLPEPDPFNEPESLYAWALCRTIQFDLLEILRPGSQHTGHVTDNRFPDHLIDHTITNDGTPEELLEKALSSVPYLEQAA